MLQATFEVNDLSYMVQSTNRKKDEPTVNTQSFTLALAYGVCFLWPKVGVSNTIDIYKK